MKYSVQEILQYIKEEDVKFIQLVFCDIYGKPKKFVHTVEHENPRIC